MGLPDRGLNLAPGGDRAARAGQPQALRVLFERPGYGPQAGGEVGPVLLGCGRPVVEAVPQPLNRGADVVQMAQRFPGVEQFDLEAKPFPHRGPGDLIDRVCG